MTAKEQQPGCLERKSLARHGTRTSMESGPCTSAELSLELTRQLSSALSSTPGFRAGGGGWRPVLSVREHARALSSIRLPKEMVLHPDSSEAGV